MGKKRETTPDRAFIAQVIRGVSMTEGCRASLLWKESAEALLHTFDDDDNISDVTTTVIYYGYVIGLGTALTTMGIAPFDDPERADRVRDSWSKIVREYLREMRKGVGREDVED